MPSLMPGKPGTKEAFGISKVHHDYTIVIPPKAIQHYHITEPDYILLITGHRGKSGLGMIRKEAGLNSIFKKYIEKVKQMEKIYWLNERAFTMLELKNGRIKTNKDILQAFLIDIGDRLLVVKSTTVTMSFTPVEIWIDNFKKHGFTEAIENMKKLEIF